MPQLISAGIDSIRNLIYFKINLKDTNRFDAYLIFNLFMQRNIGWPTKEILCIFKNIHKMPKFAIMLNYLGAER